MTPHSLPGTVALVTLAIVTSLAGPLRPAHAEITFEVAQRLPDAPVAKLSVGSDGNIYGVAWHALRKVVFRIDGAGTYTLLHTFAPDYPFAVGHFSRLVLGRDGALYGVAGQSFFRIDNQGNYTL